MAPCCGVHGVPHDVGWVEGIVGLSLTVIQCGFTAANPRPIVLGIDGAGIGCAIGNG